jgi:multidrug efflux pump subunit AcrA (membrane-fusion protein)
MSIVQRTVFLLGVVSAASGGAIELFAQAGPPKAPPPTLVEVTEVEYRAVQPTQTFVGTVMPVQKAIVGSAVDGRVIEFPINEGDYVEAGATLGQLLTETIEKELDAATPRPIARCGKKK